MHWRVCGRRYYHFDGIPHQSMHILKDHTVGMTNHNVVVNTKLMELYFDRQIMMMVSSWIIKEASEKQTISYGTNNLHVTPTFVKSLILLQHYHTVISYCTLPRYRYIHPSLNTCLFKKILTYALIDSFKYGTGTLRILNDFSTNTIEFQSWNPFCAGFLSSNLLCKCRNLVS